MKNRHLSRIAAMQLLFQSATLCEWNEAAYQRFFAAFYSENSAVPLEPEAQSFTLQLVEVAQNNLHEIDLQIEALNLSWSMSRMSKIDLSILRLALAEARLEPELDKKIIINEAINLAKEFAADDSHRFINAALDRAFFSNTVEVALKK